MKTSDNFRKLFYKEHTGAALVLSEENRFYFTAFSSSDGAVLFTPSETYLIVDFRYYEMAKAAVDGIRVILAEGSLLKKARELCEAENISELTVEDTYVTVALNKRISELFGDVKLSYFGDMINKMRAVKTESEIQRIARAQEITDAAFSHILSVLNERMTENDVALELELFMRKSGAQQLAFKTIAVSGKKSSLPHGEPGNIPLTKNSFLTMDFGARLDGYCADMTRTVVIGRADSEMRRVYDTVFRAQEAALSVIREGVLGSEVDAAARDIIYREGYENCFGHSTGHGLGIEVHESPSYSPSFKNPIPENSVLSVEPGIYIEGRYGVRIEDIAVVGVEKPINLTKSDKKLIEI